jgi:hypothetical protein
VDNLQFGNLPPYLRPGADPKGGLQPPYSWCSNGDTGRVREKKRWRKEDNEEKERKKLP